MTQSPLEMAIQTHSTSWSNKPLIVVVGVHRSLSSCLAACLEQLGVFMGPITNGGEDHELAKLLESLMPFPSTTKQKTFDERVESIRNCLLRINGLSEGKPIGVKYPHLAAMLLELQAAWPSLRVIHITRPLQQSIESLITRSTSLNTEEWIKADESECKKLQEFLFDEKEKWLSHHDHLTVTADDLLYNTRRTIQVISKYLESAGLIITKKLQNKAVEIVKPQAAVHSKPQPDWINDTTVVIKAHERPGYLDDLLNSIHRYYPGAKILVGDDSKWISNRIDVDIVRLSYDIGLAAGRNCLIQQVKTPFTLLCDDDFVFTEKTKIELLHGELLKTGFDLISGLTTCWKPRAPFVGHFVQEDSVLYLRQGPAYVHNGFPCYDVVENFFLAKTESLQKVKWDDKLKVGEHIDWCLRARESGLLIGFTPFVTIVDQSPLMPDTDYAKHRTRAKGFNKTALIEWGKKLGFHHYKQELPNTAVVNVELKDAEEISLDTKPKHCCFIKTDDNWWQCKICGYLYRKITTKPPRRMCGNNQSKMKTSIPPESRDPTDMKQPPNLLGDKVEKALAVIGITSEKVSQWLGRPCGCRQRKERLNQLDLWARRILSGKKKDGRKELETIIEE